MPEFACRLGNANGEIVEQVLVAENEAALRRECERREMFVISARRKSGAAKTLRRLSPFRPRVSTKEFLFFNQELVALIKAGLPIVSSLDLLI
jgi:type IV pilus assembly protein PilC